MRNAARFFLIDAFAAEPFSGEPFLLLDDDGRSLADMGVVAAEFQGITGVALLAPSNPINAARLQFFPQNDQNPAPLGGLVAAATLIARRSAPEILARGSVVVSLETGGTAHSCEVIRNRHGVCYAEFALVHAGTTQPRADDVSLAAALGIGVEELSFERHRARHVVEENLVIAPLASRAALARATLSPEFSIHFGEAALVLAYARAEPGEDIAVEGRLFGRGGTAQIAAPAITAFAAAAVEAERPEDGEHEIFVDLLDSRDRRSRLTLRLSVAEGELRETRCGGQAAVVASGEIDA